GKDDAGYSALTTRMRHAKLTCQEILGMFQARAVLEEEYGKKLLKLSKSPLGKDELGSLRDSLDVVRYEIEATGKSHIELAGKMKDQLESALAEFNNSQKDKRKLHQASIDRTFRNKQLYMQQLVKAKEKYETECIRTKGLSAAKMNLVGKELDKVSIKMEKTELASRAADVEYQASIRQLTEINDKWIVEWRSACDKFQVLEEQRIDYLRMTLWNYANIISSTCVADDESCEGIRSSLELCDVNQNLQSFIDAFATGEEASDMPIYIGSKHTDGPLPDNNSNNNSPATAESPAGSRIQDARVRTVGGPHQPISSRESSAPSSRRQSVYSATDRSDTMEGTNGVTSGSGAVSGAGIGGHVDMALTIGTNVFKLDPQTTAMLNQVDDTTTHAPQAGGFPVSSKSLNGENRPPSASGHYRPQQSLEENILGISLDASGTVKENRFPHWQPQVPLQSQPSPGFATGHGAPYQQQQQQQQYQHGALNALYHANNGGRVNPGGESGNFAVHTRSQTVPIQSEHTGSHFQGADPAALHRRTPSGSYAAPQQYTGNQLGQAVVAGGGNVSAPQVPKTSQMTHDGRPILFYGNIAL
ncbi:hypothetical protein BGZ58_005098, partial [Dissophora ornata]